MSRRYLHEEVQAPLKALLAEGDVAVDATVGNGQDTLFLARCVGEEGHVYGFDLQTVAIEAGARRLREAGMEARVTLHHRGHESLLETLLPGLEGKVAAVMFNLGYLPGSDKSCITRTETTLAALEQALSLLKPAGLLSVVAYPGHAGGREEAEAVKQWARQRQAEGYRVEITAPPSERAISPEWVLIRRPG